MTHPWRGRAAPAIGLIALLLALPAAGCAMGSPDGPVAAGQAAAPGFEDAAWRLAEMDGKTVPAGPREAYLHFDSASGRVSGSSGCNRIAGPYRRDGSGLTLGPLASTRMACPDGAAEARFLAALERTAGYRQDGRRLTLLDRAGQALVVLEEATKR